MEKHSKSFAFLQPETVVHSPGGKIEQLEHVAQAAEMPNVVIPMQEVWDRDLRNSIFHSDYSLHGGEVRFKKANMPCAYQHDQVLTLVNRALAYFDALRFLRSHYVGSYTEPKEILVHPDNAAIPDERAVIMVREGHGAIGLKSAWTAEEIRRGRVPWRIAHYSEEERLLADADPMRASFPAKAFRSDAPDV